MAITFWEDIWRPPGPLVTQSVFDSKVFGSFRKHVWQSPFFGYVCSYLIIYKTKIVDVWGEPTVGLETPPSQTSVCFFVHYIQWKLYVVYTSQTHHNSTSWTFRSIHGEKTFSFPGNTSPFVSTKTTISPAPKRGAKTRRLVPQQVPRGRTFSRSCNHATFHGAGGSTHPGRFDGFTVGFGKGGMYIFLGTTPPPRMPVTTRIIPFLVGNPYKSTSIRGFPKMVGFPNNHGFSY